MGYGDIVFLVIVGFLFVLIVVGWRGKRKKHYDGSDDYNGLRPERNDDGRGGGGLE
jgi:hypothetical protein